MSFKINWLAELSDKNMWNEDLQERTRTALTNIEAMYVMPDLTMPLKKFAKSPSVFGVIHVSDVAAQRFIIKSRSDETVWQYHTLDELIDDGWAID